MKYEKQTGQRFDITYPVIVWSRDKKHRKPWAYDPIDQQGGAQIFIYDYRAGEKHIVPVVNGMVLDNGIIVDYPFPAEELSHFGDLVN